MVRLLDTQEVFSIKVVKLYIVDGAFIRRARSIFDKSGEVAFYIDGAFVRRARSIFDKSGEVVYYRD